MKGGTRNIMEPTDIMTVEEVARYLKLKPQTVYKWAQEGQIPAAKLGKEWRFRRRLLDEWIDRRIYESQAGQNLIERRQADKDAPPADPPSARIESLDGD
jgi:excisionase family DNA binding protein